MNQWWQNGLVYHLYIKSFYDSKGKGIGDFKGIEMKLDYLKDLGIDAIWLSPFFDSPMVDNGYDIKDYRHVNPLFGSDQDLDDLFNEMKKRDIKIIIDLVLNHSSDQHAWFKDAMNNPKSKYRDYYIFKEAKDINNARSLFGGSTWEKCDDGSYYYHTFAKEQPDLNWENPNLRQEIYDIVNFWLNKGVDGFRLDAITFIKKNPDYPSLKADDHDGLFSCTKTSLNQPGAIEFLNELKKNTWKDKPIYTVGEAPGVTYEELAKFIGPEGFLTSVFDFSYTDIDVSGDAWKLEFDWSYEDFQKKLDHMQLQTQEVGMASTYLENHDNPRSLNKFFKQLDIAPEDHFYMSTALHIFYLFLRGTAFEYQGQEIGMINVKFNVIDEVEDLHTIDQYHRALERGLSQDDALKLVYKRSRDHARFPVYFDDQVVKVSNRIKPFVRDVSTYGCMSVEKQMLDSKSVYHFVRSLIHYKKQPDIKTFLTNARYEKTVSVSGLIAYKRVLADKEMIVLVNMTDKEKDYILNGYKLVKSNYSKTTFRNKVDAYEALILQNF